MALYQDKVAILKGRDFGEFDRILILFGHNSGKFAAIAKSVRKIASRKRGHLQTFSLCKVSCAEGKKLDVIVEAESYFSLDTEKFDVDSFERIGFAGMVLDRLLPEGVPEREIFKWWSNYISGDLSERSTKKFIVCVLVELGFMPEDRARKILESRSWKIERLQTYVQKILDTV